MCIWSLLLVLKKKQRNKTMNIWVVLRKRTTVCTGLMLVCCKDLIIYAISIPQSQDDLVGYKENRISIQTFPFKISVSVHHYKTCNMSVH